MQNDRIVREPERKSVTGLSRTTWWEMERRAARARDREFPRRVQLVGGRVGWRLSELQAWVRSRPAAEPNEAA